MANVGEALETIYEIYGEDYVNRISADVQPWHQCELWIHAVEKDWIGGDRTYVTLPPEAGSNTNISEPVPFAAFETAKNANLSQMTVNTAHTNETFEVTLDVDNQVVTVMDKPEDLTLTRGMRLLDIANNTYYAITSVLGKTITVKGELPAGESTLLPPATWAVVRHMTPGSIQLRAAQYVVEEILDRLATCVNTLRHSLDTFQYAPGWSRTMVKAYLTNWTEEGPLHNFHVSLVLSAAGKPAVLNLAVQSALCLAWLKAPKRFKQIKLYAETRAAIAAAETRAAIADVKQSE